MKEKHLTRGIMKKILIPTLTLVLMAGSVVPSFAESLTEEDLVSASQSGQTELVYQLNTNQLYGAVTSTVKIENFKDFKDYKANYWGNQYMESLFNVGGITGYPTGDFRPENTITTAEFLSIVIKSTGNELKAEGNWAQGVLETAQELKLIASSNISNTEADKPITREKVAYILLNAMDTVAKEDTSSISTSDGADYVRDLSLVSSTYKDDVIKAYKLGIVSGDAGTNSYRPSDSLKRSEACVVITRLIGLSDRATPSKITPQATTDWGQWQVMIDRYEQTGKFVFEEGDLFNGKPLVRDPDTGILGLDIGGNLYTGMPQPQIGPNGTFEPGYQADGMMEAGGLGGAYIRDKRNGYTFFESEWTQLELAAYKNLDKHEGESGYFDIKGNPIPAGDTTTTPYWSWADGTGALTYHGPMYRSVF